MFSTITLLYRRPFFSIQSLISVSRTRIIFFHHSITSKVNNSTDTVEHYFTSLLGESTHKDHLNQIHNQICVNGLQNNGFIMTKFINVSSNLNDVHYAREVFEMFPDQYVFLWNAIIRAYSMHSMFETVLKIYSRMQHSRVGPDGYTFPYLLKACGGQQALNIGKAIHAQIYRHGFNKDLFLQNGLLSFYINCSENSSAHVIFSTLIEKDVVSWTSMISGYAQNGFPLEALKIFTDMRRSKVKLDWVVLVSALRACSDMDELHQGRCIHGLAIKMGHEFVLDLRISAISLYAKCGELMSAKSLFEDMKINDVILWNAMLSGTAKNGIAEEALELFNEMVARKIQPDAITIQSAVLACAHLGSLDKAKWIHSFVQNSDFNNDVIVSTALIDMYAKCGSVELARHVFNHTLHSDVVVWSAMIMGYALNGCGREAVSLFNEMKETCVSPNDITFTGLITACSHSGLVREGWDIFHAMKDYGLEPTQQHYAGIVDLLGRAGYLYKAYDFIKTMPVKPGVSVWGSLLSVCKIHRNVALGEYAAQRLFELDPLNTGHYVQLSNLYAAAQMWDGVERVRETMKSKGTNKDFGYSMVEIDHGKVQDFLG